MPLKSLALGVFRLVGVGRWSGDGTSQNSVWSHQPTDRDDTRQELNSSRNAFRSSTADFKIPLGQGFYKHATLALCYINYILSAFSSTPYKSTFSRQLDFLLAFALRVFAFQRFQERLFTVFRPTTQTGARPLSDSQYHQIGGTSPLSETPHSTPSGDGVACVRRHHHPTSITRLRRIDNNISPI